MDLMNMGASMTIDLDSMDFTDLIHDYSSEKIEELVRTFKVREFLIQYGNEEVIIQYVDDNTYSYKKIEIDEEGKRQVMIRVDNHRWKEPIFNFKFISNCIISPAFRKSYETSAEEFDKIQKMTR